MYYRRPSMPTVSIAYRYPCLVVFYLLFVLLVFSYFAVFRCVLLAWRIYLLASVPYAAIAVSPFSCVNISSPPRPSTSLTRKVQSFFFLALSPLLSIVSTNLFLVSTSNMMELNSEGDSANFSSYSGSPDGCVTGGGGDSFSTIYVSSCSLLLFGSALNSSFIPLIVVAVVFRVDVP